MTIMTEDVKVIKNKELVALDAKKRRKENDLMENISKDRKP